jgi:hypothetical protein
VQKKIVNNIADIYCEHIIIENRGKKHDIFFPSNGIQPTTPEAVEYSCAKIEADKPDSEITLWYMRMFGWDKTDDNHPDSVVDRIKAGFDKNNKTIEIITLNTKNYKLYDGICVATATNEGRKLFWQLFRQIASASVGRVLLYRLLIEIRRADKKKVGIAESSELHAKERNQYRTVTVAYCRKKYLNNNIISDGFFFDKELAEDGTKMGILFAKNTETEIPTVNGNLFPLRAASARPDKKYIIQLKRPLYIALFHEMLHWYQHLRYYLRARNELTVNIETGENTQHNDMLNYYYPSSDPKKPIDPGSFWRNDSLFSISGSVRVDEMRIILGIPKGTVGFLNGDDLSENLFRYFAVDAFRKMLTRNIMKFYIRFGSAYSENDLPSAIQINKAYKAVEKIAGDYK